MRIARSLFVFGASIACGLCADTARPIVPVEVRSLDVPSDGFWNGLTVASDGRVYIGMCKHGGTAHVLRYDPARDQVSDLGAMADATHETWLGKEPQSKIHVPFLEAKDGRLFFATHFGNFWNNSREFERDAYPGSHWLVLDPKTDHIEDLGIAAEHEGMMALALDRERNLLYGMTLPRGHLVQYDIQKGRTRDLGRIANWDSIVRSIVVDDAGRVYGAVAPNHVFRYDPQKDLVELLPAVLPHNKDVRPAQYGSSTGTTIWRASFYDEGRHKIYGIQAGSGEMFELDPVTGEARFVVSMCPDELIGRPDAPYASLALTRGPGDILYYAAQSGARRFDYGGTEGAASGGPRAHLITYDFASGKREDHGAMEGPGGQIVLGAEGAAADKAGNVYFVGAVKKPGSPLAVSLIIYRTQQRRKNP